MFAEEIVKEIKMDDITKILYVEYWILYNCPVKKEDPIKVTKIEEDFWKVEIESFLPYHKVLSIDKNLRTAIIKSSNEMFEYIKDFRKSNSEFMVPNKFRTGLWQIDLTLNNNEFEIKIDKNWPNSKN